MNLAHLIAKFPKVEERPSLDHPALNIPVEQLWPLMKYLRDEEGYEMLMDVTAIDGGERRPRFTVVYHLLALVNPHYLRVACDLPDSENPVAPSLVSLWPGANWHERETFDMFGIRFEGHPDLRRILMWDGYPYFPLRKEFPLAGYETDLPAPDVAERTKAKVLPAPMMGGPFTAAHGSHMHDNEPRAKDESWTELQPKPIN